MSSTPPSMTGQELIRELRRCAGWEDTGGAIGAARRLAALKDPEVPAAALMVRELVSLDAVDLSDDAGDVGDELYRARKALRVGLVACGSESLPWLRPLLAAEASEAAQVALRVLAELGDQEALPAARRWVADDAAEAHAGRLAAIEALGWLRAPDAPGLLRDVVARVDPLHASWTKRIAGHAFGRLGDVAALEWLLEDEDWFARLGAAEALAQLPAGQGEAARQRALHDRDPRVAQSARRG